jgi:hypothetical protein
MKIEHELKIRLSEMEDLKVKLDLNDMKYGNIRFDDYLKVVTEIEMLKLLIDELRCTDYLEKIRIDTYKRTLEWYYGLIKK